MHIFGVDAELLRDGKNLFDFKLLWPAPGTTAAVIDDLAITVDYPGLMSGKERDVRSWLSQYSDDKDSWQQQGGQRDDDLLVLQQRMKNRESLAWWSADTSAVGESVVAEAVMTLRSGAVVFTVSNGKGFATYLLEEFGGSVPFYSTADSRRVMLTTAPHRNHKWWCAGVCRRAPAQRPESCDATDAALSVWNAVFF